MTARDQLAAIIRYLRPCALVSSGLAGMVLVDGVPMLRVSQDRVHIMAACAGLDLVGARLVSLTEDPAHVAGEILDRLAMVRRAA